MVLFVAERKNTRYEPKKWHKLRYELTPDFNLLWIQVLSSSHFVYNIAEQHKMRSQLASQFMPFFRLIARISTFRDKKYRNLTFRDKKYRILTFTTKQSCI